MINFKNGFTAVTIGIVLLLGIEGYGYYSIRHLLDTRLSRIENGIESVRAADADVASKIQGEAAKPEPVITKPKEVKPGVGSPHLLGDRNVAAKVQKMLPSGTNLKEAAMGFRNEKDFISAVYVSKDLGIPFSRLKDKITGKHAVSMEAAIRDLRRDLNKARAKAEVEKGQRQAIEVAKLGKSTLPGA